MKIISPLPHKRGRLEIIPLIDIMFFLLAAFMVVSIGKIHLKSLKITLPTNVPTAQKETREDFIDISVNAEGQVQLDKQLLTTKAAVTQALQGLYAKNKDQKFLISADKDTRHGDVMALLGELRASGFQKVAFSIDGQATPGASASAAAPAASSTLAPPASGATPAPVTQAASPIASAPLAPPQAEVPAPAATLPATASVPAAASPAPSESAAPAASEPAAPAVIPTH